MHLNETQQQHLPPRSQKTNLKHSMRTQIVSMLKGIVIDDQQEDLQDLSENLRMEESFYDSENEDNETKYIPHIFEEDSTSDSQNSQVDSTQNASPNTYRDVSKTQTAKFENKIPLTNPSLFLNTQDIERKSKKSITSTVPVNSSSSSSLQTPMMPLHTFNFKNSYLKHNANASHHHHHHHKDNQHEQQLQETNTNIVISLAKQKSPSKRHKRLSSFEQKENDLNNLILQYKSINWEVYNYIKGQLTEYIKHQQTSRLFQYYFEQTPPEITHLIFMELFDELNELLLDPYANYFCLKIFFHLTHNDRIRFVNKIAYNFAVLSTNKISTYPIQCIIQALTNTTEQNVIIQGLLGCSLNNESNIIKLSFDLYGTHVVEKILQHFNLELLLPVFNFICNDFLFIANNPNGLCVIKKVIEVTNNTMYFDNVFEQLYKNALLLIQNPYGNYALQHALDVWNIAQSERLIKQFQGNLIYLSIQKYSSNVIEKCLEKSPLFLFKFCKELLADNTHSTLVLFLRNTFGNFVLQTIMNCVKNTPWQTIIVNAIVDALGQIQEKSILVKWKKKLTTYNNNTNINNNVYCVSGGNNNNNNNNNGTVEFY